MERQSVSSAGSGRKLIINDKGSTKGLLEGLEKCFVVVTDCGDYCKEMNCAHFENWWEKTVLPSFPAKGVIFIKYHSRQTGESKNTNIQLEETAILKIDL